MKPNIATLFLLVTLGAVNAVLFTPALPAMQAYFGISISDTQLTISVFLVGYAVGQLLYGPLANRFGFKAAIYSGVGLNLFGAVLCLASFYCHVFSLIVIGRLLMALGSSVGLMISFAIVMFSYPAVESKTKLSHLLAGFGIAPGISIMIGGFLVQHIGWQSCFYFLAGYGLIIAYLCSQLPKFNQTLDHSALKAHRILFNYLTQIKKPILVCGALVMGSCSVYNYIFAAEAPFIGISFMHMSPSEFGIWSLLPSLGIFLGSHISAKLSTILSSQRIIAIGYVLMLTGAGLMLLGLSRYQHPVSLFLSMAIALFGNCLIYIQSSIIALHDIPDRANASAMMSFLNMGVTTLIVFSLGAFTHTLLLMPMLFIIISAVAILISLKIAKLSCKSVM